MTTLYLRSRSLRIGLMTLTALASVTSSAHADSWFAIDRSEYFQALGQDDPEEAALTQSLEKRLIEQSQEIVNWSKLNPKKTHSSGGMFLVYTAMLILNENHKVSSFSNQAIINRFAMSEEFLDLALKLTPEDTRIPSWHIANVFRYEYATEGAVSESTLDQIIDYAVESPIFHLFNALTMASDYDFGPKREDQLLELAELMNGTDSPCWPPIFRRGEAKQCKTTSKTPFAFQGVTVYLGDVFFKKAVREMETQPELANTYFKKALKAYQRLNFFLFKRKTNRWEQKPNLEARIELAEKPTLQATRAYLNTQSFKDIYTCNSCHQHGHSRRDLTVFLPSDSLPATSQFKTRHAQQKSNEKTDRKGGK